MNKELTKRETEIVALAFKPKTDDEIAEITGLSVGYIRKIRRRAINKLKAS